MAVRSSMTELIGVVRGLIGDTIQAAEQFTDQDLQDSLDMTRADVRLFELTGAETIQSGGTVVWLDFYSEGYQYWEADEKLQDRNWATLTPATSERQVGHWTFSANQYPPVYITGKTYDPYAAAADLLETFAANLFNQVDINVAGQQFAFSQKQKQVLAAADRLRSKANCTRAAVIRSDV